MKYTLGYIKYFFYLALNWSFPLAWFIVKREIAGEKKYNIRTTGIDDLTTSVDAVDREHASIYQPINFYTAEKLFGNITSQDLNGTFLDMGCGKGRVLAMAAYYGFKDIIGVDFSAKLCYDAEKTVSGMKQKYPQTRILIECEDARDYVIPPNVSVLFLFNPFDDLVMQDFLSLVEKSLKQHTRTLKILYANPQCKCQWLKAGFKETFSFKKMKFLEGSVLVNQ